MFIGMKLKNCQNNMEKDFYSDISSEYDEVFKSNQAQVNFINSFSKNKSKVLEVGCGTGSLALMLKDEFNKISAIDLNSDMVSIAKEKDAENSVDFRTLSMLDLDDAFVEDSFEIVSCIGNTLVHLDNIQQVEDFLFSSYKLLKKGGHLLIQIVNYDRVIDKDIKSLPYIDNDKISFERNYSLVDGKVKFDTVLYSKTEDKTYTNSINLLALRKTDLENILKKLSFEEIQFYSNFKKDSWSLDSMPTILSCKK